MTLGNIRCEKMRRLWAPWRIKYILGEKGGCIFCEKSKESKDSENYLIFRGKSCFLILNSFPYSNGHLMIAPYRHVRELNGLTDVESKELMALAKKAIQLLEKTVRPQGFNLGMNLGGVAGAGVEGHLHLHIVPRWEGDTNFMPTIADTKVMPESLHSTYDKMVSYVHEMKLFEI